MWETPFLYVTAVAATCGSGDDKVIVLNSLLGAEPLQVARKTCGRKLWQNPQNLRSMLASAATDQKESGTQFLPIDCIYV